MLPATARRPPAAFASPAATISTSATVAARTFTSGISIPSLNGACGVAGSSDLPCTADSQPFHLGYRRNLGEGSVRSAGREISQSRLFSPTTSRIGEDEGRPRERGHIGSGKEATGERWNVAGHRRKGYGGSERLWTWHEGKMVDSRFRRLHRYFGKETAQEVSSLVVGSERKRAVRRERDLRSRRDVLCTSLSNKRPHRRSRRSPRTSLRWTDLLPLNARPPRSKRRDDRDYPTEDALRIPKGLIPTSFRRQSLSLNLVSPSISRHSPVTGAGRVRHLSTCSSRKNSMNNVSVQPDSFPTDIPSGRAQAPTSQETLRSYDDKENSNRCVWTVILTRLLHPALTREHSDKQADARNAIFIFYPR